MERCYRCPGRKKWLGYKNELWCGGPVLAALLESWIWIKLSTDTQTRNVLTRTSKWLQENVVEPLLNVRSMEGYLSIILIHGCDISSWFGVF